MSLSVLISKQKNLKNIFYKKKKKKSIKKSAQSHVSRARSDLLPSPPQMDCSQSMSVDCKIVTRLFHFCLVPGWGTKQKLGEEAGNIQGGSEKFLGTF